VTVSTVTFGTAGGSTPITATLDNVQANPPGFLFGTPGMLDGTPNSSRGSYTNGQRAAFWRCEAAALVAAGAGAYS
jgi:hypothetical protein